MNQLTPSIRVWNRACQGGGASPLPGDSALAGLLAFHSLAMNGGVLHACECLEATRLEAAEAGFRYFGFDSVADFILRAQRILESDDDLETNEARLDREYASFVPDDTYLASRFETHFREHACDFANL
jgi:hypothetical protein